MKRQKFNKLGIALAGGGGRGAYQVGVFRALLERQLLIRRKYWQERRWVR